MRKLRKIKTNVVSFFDRNYNRIFNRKRCITVRIESDIFEYNDIVTMGKKSRELRYLGKGWYKILKINEKK